MSPKQLALEALNDINERGELPYYDYSRLYDAITSGPDESEGGLSAEAAAKLDGLIAQARKAADGDLRDADPYAVGVLNGLTSARFALTGKSATERTSLSDDELEFAVSDGTYGPLVPTSNVATQRLDEVPRGYRLLGRRKVGPWFVVMEGGAQ